MAKSTADQVDQSSTEPEQDGKQNAELKSEKVDELVAFAKDKGIHPEDQQAIAEHILGIADQIFAALPEEYAEDILSTLKEKGHTTVINEATGQTDITDPDQQQGDHPVFDDLWEVVSEHDLTEMDQVHISSAVIGERYHWRQLSRSQAVTILTEIQTYSVDEILENWSDYQQSDDGPTPPADAGTPPKEGNLEAVTVGAEVPSIKVYDDEEGGMVEVSGDERRIANSLQQRMDLTTLMVAVIMMRMSDEKLYRAVGNGYSSFREYAEVRCPFGYRQAQKYAAIGRKFAPLLPSDMTKGELSSPDQQALNGNMESLSELGVNKMYELARVEDADFSELPSEGKVVFTDGTEIDVEEMKSQSAREFKRKLDEHRQYQQDLEEELNQTALEKEKAEERAEQIEQEAETGMKYKDMYGQKSDQFEAQKSRILTARAKAADLNQLLSKIEDLDPEFDSLVDELRDLHKMIDRGLKRLREDNLEALQGIRN